MQFMPPPDSKISVTMDGLDEIISIPQPTSYSRYFAGAFLLFWLGAWFFAFFNVASRASFGTPNFDIFWLGGWTVGGLFAAFFLYRALRPAIPETLRLRAESFLYDSGIPPFQQFNYRDRNQLLPKRDRIEVNRQQLESLRLRDTESGNRLTVDIGSRRIELGRAASEIEREWLFRTLTDRYGIKRNGA
jgi:hypothetical protein